MDGKIRAQKTWGSSPTGSTSAKGSAPGTKDFFERALKYRSKHEMPWLPDVIPFQEMRGKRVLEIGFGPGYDALSFMQAGATYSGIDITPENLERTRKHLALFGFEPEVRQGDAEALPFDDASFDVAYSNGVLHHVPSIEQAFSEVHRVLEPGGDFYVLVYNKNSLFYRITLAIWYQIIHGYRHKETLQEQLSRIEFNEADERPIVNVYSKRELRALLQQTGFKVSSIKVRKLTWEDLPAVWFVHRFFKYIPRSLLHFLGKAVGWYLIAHARK
ncbi:type 11 methyltransferase [Tepidicaulis marinus]|uniref:Type 11 methyltransferase n=1 Tax=Tepidicaulis marinus TaxID=1333998 RepID=A0A081BAK4_9HYPH|nr:class I SAM-dependent methyltransferase [Tepidicaulis marinus]GAK45072.1 type 11 methyltransferase [Tepidicaulis marinus]